MSKINENILRIIGSVNLPEKLEQGNRYMVETEIDIYEVSNRDNQDGTFDLIYKGKQTGKVNVLQGIKIIKAESKGTMSKKLHGAVWFFHNTLGITQPFDEYYNEVMRKIIAYLPEIIEFLNSKS